MYGTTGGAILDASGTPDSSTVNFTAPALWAFGAKSKTFTLTGDNLGTNIFAASITNNSGPNTTSVTKDGAGTWWLSNPANTYTGQTTIAEGTLVVSTLAGLGTNSPLGAPPTVALGTLAMGSGGNATLKYVGAGTAYSDRRFNLNGAPGTVATLDASGGGPITLNSAGNAQIANANLILTLAGTNTQDNALATQFTNSTARPWSC